MAISNENGAFIKHYIVNLYTSSGCAIMLTILLSLDVLKDFQRKSHWILVQALVLTALIIQMLTWVDNYLNLNVNSDDCWRNVITHRSVRNFQPTLSETVQVEILSVSLTRRKSL